MFDDRGRDYGSAHAYPLAELSQREVEALRGAAVWYAKYHAAAIAEHAHDRGAYAVAEREEYLDLIAALRKLGVRLRVPEALMDPPPHAA